MKPPPLLVAVRVEEGSCVLTWRDQRMKLRTVSVMPYGTVTVEEPEEFEWDQRVSRDEAERVLRREQW